MAARSETASDARARALARAPVGWAVALGCAACAVTMPSLGAALVFALPMWGWVCAVYGRGGWTPTRVVLAWALAVVVFGALMCGAPTLVDEDALSALLVVPLLLFSIGLALGIWSGSPVGFWPCALLALSPALAVPAALGWTRLQTALHAHRVTEVDTTAWDARAGEHNVVGELTPDRVHVYHWTPFCRRVSVINEHGSPDVLVWIASVRGRLVVTHAQRVWYMSSGRGGVWPDR